MAIHKRADIIRFAAGHGLKAKGDRQKLVILSKSVGNTVTWVDVFEGWQEAGDFLISQKRLIENGKPPKWNMKTKSNPAKRNSIKPSRKTVEAKKRAPRAKANASIFADNPAPKDSDRAFDEIRRLIDGKIRTVPKDKLQAWVSYTQGVIDGFQKSGTITASVAKNFLSMLKTAASNR